MQQRIQMIIKSFLLLFNHLDAGASRGARVFLVWAICYRALNDRDEAPGEKDISDHLTLGGELFHSTEQALGD
jgi:hypothetical protein